MAATAGAENIDYGSLEQMFGEPVTTSATGKPQRVSEVPMAMTIITADQIRRAGAVDIPGILKEYTDLDVLQFTRGNSDVSVRGYNSTLEPRLLVLVNGRQVYVDYFGFTNWDAIPVQLSELRQIEVVKGPNTALFGFNAAAGVVNIITVSPLYDQANEVSVRVGTQGYKDVSAVGTAHLGDKFGVRLSTGGYNARPFNENLTNVLTAPIARNPTRRAANLDMLGQVSDDLQVGFEASHSLVNQNQWLLEFFARPDRLESDSLKASFSANTGIGMIDGQVYKNIAFTNYQMVRAAGGIQDLIDGDKLKTREAVSSAKLQDLFKIDADNTVRIAGEYRYNTMNSVPMNGVEAGYTVYSGSAMWDWAVTPKLDLNNAVRFDHLQLERSGPSVTGPMPITNNFFNLAGINALVAQAAGVASPSVTWPYTNADFNNHTIGEVSVNSGAVFKATDADTFRLSYGRGIQVPPLVDYAWYDPAIRSVQLGGGVIASVPILVNGNPTLEPTIVTNYELGYSREVKDFASKLSASVFYDTYKSLSTADPYVHAAVTGNQTLLQGENIGDSNSRGLELGIDGHTDTWRWGANYRLEFIHDDLHLTRYDANGNLVTKQINNLSTVKNYSYTPYHPNFGEFSIDWNYYLGQTEGGCSSLVIQSMLIGELFSGAS
ncbi:MAG: TonB-dependent receptor, partial [Alphaproteobacteria bacterium]|nr:TonB-dependent receptor [Alphaproteobacteria bacterium]